MAASIVALLPGILAGVFLDSFFAVSRGLADDDPKVRPDQSF
jgi:hypothetical protein